MNKYDAYARLVFHFAREESEALGHYEINPEHLLLGLLRSGGVASRVLTDVGVTLGEVRRLTEEMTVMTGRGAGLANDEPVITPRTNRVTKLAALEAERLGSERVRTEHILLAILGEGDGTGRRILARLAEPEAVRQRLEAALSNEGVTGRGRAALLTRLRSSAKMLATAIKV